MLLILGAVVLERAGWLPERVAGVVQRVEVWLEPLLCEAGIELPPRPTEPDATPRMDPEVDDRSIAAAALALLDQIRVEAERPRGYDREAWPHWLDADGDCQDTRQEVLASERLEPRRLGPGVCRIAIGLWRDAYTGEMVRDPGALDVDHLVPLAEAYRSGGYAWSTERRAAFANDLGDPRSLIAVTASANRSKGDQAPEVWLPPVAGYWCHYTADWVAVKVRWDLAMDERERVTVGNLLRACVAG